MTKKKSKVSWLWLGPAWMWIFKQKSYFPNIQANCGEWKEFSLYLDENNIIREKSSKKKISLMNSPDYVIIGHNKLKQIKPKRKGDFNYPMEMQVVPRKVAPIKWNITNIE